MKNHRKIGIHLHIFHSGLFWYLIAMYFQGTKNSQKCRNSKLYWPKICNDRDETYFINAAAWLWNETSFENWRCDCCFRWSQCSLRKTSHKNYKAIIKLKIKIFLAYPGYFWISQSVIILELSNKTTKYGATNIRKAPYGPNDMISNDFLLQFISTLWIIFQAIWKNLWLGSVLELEVNAQLYSINKWLEYDEL